MSLLRRMDERRIRRDGWRSVLAIDLAQGRACDGPYSEQQQERSPCAPCQFASPCRHVAVPTPSFGGFTMNPSAQLIRQHCRAVDMDQGLGMPSLDSASVLLDGRSQVSMRAEHRQLSSSGGLICDPDGIQMPSSCRDSRARGLLISATEFTEPERGRDGGCEMPLSCRNLTVSRQRSARRLAAALMFRRGFGTPSLRCDRASGARTRCIYRCHRPRCVPPDTRD